MSTLLRDLAYGLRRLRTDRAVSVTAVLTLALAIGACTAIFSVVNGVLLRPLPYRDPSRLVSIGHRSGATVSGPMLVSVPGFRDYSEKTQSFSGVAVEREGAMNLTGVGPPERLSVLRVSGDWFSVYGVPPVLGQVLSPEHQIPGRDRVVVLTHALWQRRFGGDSTIIGRAIQLNDESYVVVGVMPAGFASFYRARAQLIVPAAFTGAQFNGPYGSAGWNLTARLRSGVTLQGAAAEMLALGERMRADKPGDLPAGFWLLVRSLDDLATTQIKPALGILSGAVALLLVIACANIANLFLARAAARMKEMAIRTALGASRPVVVRQLLTESVLLSLAGVLPGLLAAQVALRAIVVINPELVRASQISIDVPAAVFAFVLAVLAGVLFGTVPALQWSSPGMTGALREGARGGTPTGRARRMLGVLVVGEVALALTLLVGAGLVLKTMSELKSIDPGFDARHALVFKLSLSPVRYPTDTSQRLFRRQLTERLAGIPGVRAVGTTSNLPFGGSWWTASVLVEGQAVAPGQELPNGDLRIISPGFFEALRIRLISGRAFTEDDTQERPPVMVIDELFARRHFAGRDPVGKRVSLDPQPGQRDSAWITIVGVVGHTAHEGLDAAGRIQYYFPFAQRPSREISVAMGTNGDPVRVLPAARAVVRDLDADLPLASVSSMAALVDASFGPRRLLMVLLGGFSIIAVGLASIGLYGLVSHSVSRRSRELGIRRALGGTRSELLLLVLRQGMSLVAAGVGAGLVVGLAATRLLSSQLYQVTPTDPSTFLAGAALLSAVAVVATLIPALRATKADPLEALRTE